MNIDELETNKDLIAPEQENNNEDLQTEYNSPFDSVDNEIGDEPFDVNTEIENPINDPDSVVANSAAIKAYVKGTKIEDEIKNEERNIDVYKNKQEAFKSAIDDYVNFENETLIDAANNQTFKTTEEAEGVIQYVKNNQKETKVEYTNEDIQKVKMEIYSSAGNKFNSEEDYFNYIFSNDNINSKARYMSRSRLNELTESDGFINDASSLASSVIGKSLVDGFVGDFTNETVKSDIEKYQLITDQDEKIKEAQRLTEKFYNGTGRNSFTTRFLVEQLNNPYYKNNINNDVFIETASMLAFGVGDLVTAGKLSSYVVKGVAKNAIKKPSVKIVDGIKKVIDEGVSGVGDEIEEVNDIVVKTVGKGFKKSSSIKAAATKIAEEISTNIRPSIINEMDELKNHRGASEMLMGLVKSSKENPEIAEKIKRYTGLEESDLTDLASISNQKELDALRLLNKNKNIPADIKTVNEFQKGLRKYVDNNIDGYEKIKNTELAREAITEQDKLSFIKRKETELDEEMVKNNKYKSFDFSSDIKRNKDTDTISITRTYEYKDGRPSKKTTENIDLDINIVDGFSVINKNKYDIGKGPSELDWFLSEDSKLFYGINYGKEIGVQKLPDDLTAVMNQSVSFESLAKDEVKKLIKSKNKLAKENKEQNNLLNLVLKEGDQFMEDGINKGKAFNYFELKTKGMDDKAIELYFNFRSNADQLLSLKNKTIRDELILKNYKEYSFKIHDDDISKLKNSSTKLQFDGDELKYFGVEIKGEGKKLSVKTQDSKAIVYVAEEGKTIPINEIKNEVYNNNNLIKLVSPFGINDNSITYVLVNKFKKNVLPQDVIEKRTGWIPRKYKARHYIYTENEYGKANVVSGVVRSGDIEKEILKLKKKNPNKKYYSREEGEDIALNTKLKSGSYVDNIDVSIESNLNFSINKRKKELLKNADDKILETEDPFEVIGNQIRVTASTIPVSQYRMSMVKRLERTITDIQSSEKIGMQNILKNPANVLEGIKDEFKYKFKNEQRLIDFVNKRVVDPSDPNFKKYSDKMKHYVNYADKKLSDSLNEKINKKMEGILNYAYELENINPLQVVKSMNFIRLLGFFDPRQAILQPMQATAILSISPKYGSLGLKDYAMFKLMKKNFRRNPEVLNDIMKKTDTDLSYMENAILDLNKSNIMSSISNNADLTLQNNGIFSKAKDNLDNFIDKGMYFYDLGNELVYSTAFFAARREVLNGADRALTKSEMIKAQTITNKLAYNFTAANKAQFQDGIPSMAFQFMQVPAKAYESLAGSTLTIPEKARLLAGQGLFFGYAGVPMGEAIASYIAKTLNLSEEEVYSKHATDIEKLENGFVGYVLSNVLDYDVSTENMAFFGAGVSDIPFAPLFKTLAASNDNIRMSTLFSEAFGASSDTIYKTNSLLSNLGKSLSGFVVGDFDKGYTKAREAIFSTDSNLMKYFGTTSKISRAIMIMEKGIDVDKYGNRYATYEEDERLKRAVGAMFGFNDLEKERGLILRDQFNMIKDKEKWLKDTSLHYYKMMEENETSQEAVKHTFMLHMKHNNVPEHTAYEAWERTNTMVLNKLLSENVKDNAFKNIRGSIFNIDTKGLEALDNKAFNLYKKKEKEEEKNI